MLSVVNLKKSFGQQVLWEGISFEVPSGEGMLLMGPSGSGKSTLLSVLAGEDHWDEGTISWKGVLLQPGDRRPELCLVAQDHGLFRHLDVLSQVLLPLTVLRKLPLKSAREIAMCWLERLDLAEHAKKGIQQISGGQQQRLAIARGMALTPQVICLDEPTAAQDSVQVERIAALLMAMTAEGRSVIATTHDPRLVESFPCQHVYLSKDRVGIS